VSEDAHFSGDEPLFAVNNQRDAQRGPGCTIYTCPRCGGDRKDGMKCLKCEQSSYPSNRYAFQRFDWDPNSCPCCGNLSFESEDEHGTKDLACDRCGLPVDEHPSFIRGVQRSSFPSSSVNLHITGVRTSGYDIPMSQVRFREAMTGKREFHQPIPTAAEHSWLKGMQITWEGDGRAKVLTS
jgi:hypothetical protein